MHYFTMLAYELNKKRVRSALSKGGSFRSKYTSLETI